jgi:hypothetical protein
MVLEAKKNLIIREILKIETEDALVAVEKLLFIINNNNATKFNFSDFAGTLSNQEADELEHIIEQGCETINSDDWK